MIIDYTFHLVFWLLTQFTTPGAEKLNLEMKSKQGASTLQLKRVSEGFLLMPPPELASESPLTISVSDTTVVYMKQTLDLQRNQSISGKLSDIQKLMCTDIVVTNCFSRVSIAPDAIVLNYVHDRAGEMEFKLSTAD